MWNGSPAISILAGPCACVATHRRVDMCVHADTYTQDTTHTFFRVFCSESKLARSPLCWVITDLPLDHPSLSHGHKSQIEIAYWMPVHFRGLPSHLLRPELSISLVMMPVCELLAIQ